MFENITDISLTFPDVYTTCKSCVQSHIMRNEPMNNVTICYVISHTHSDLCANSEDQVMDGNLLSTQEERILEYKL